MHTPPSSYVVVYSNPGALKEQSRRPEGRQTEQFSSNAKPHPQRTSRSAFVEDFHSFYHIAYELAQPHLTYFRDLRGGVEVLMGLVVYVGINRRELLGSFRADRRFTAPRILRSLFRVGRGVLSDIVDRAGHNVKVAYKFLFARWSPETRSQFAFRWVVTPHLVGGKAADKKRALEPPEPPRDGTVRVKWYPSLRAPQVWPEGYWDLWVDLPLEPDGSLDLRPLKNLWGMENCYVLDRVPEKRVRLGRPSDEKLSPLAWRVLLDGHSVLGVVECPTPSMQAARRGRAFVKRMLNTDEREVAKLLMRTALLALWRWCKIVLETAVWMAITLFAITAFAVWPMLKGCTTLLLIVHLCATWLYGRWSSRSGVVPVGPPSKNGRRPMTRQ
ncbi:hypothetical protein BV20DRAFT_60012 [Pilatotrama ljubarskyi]|nr:hypothetical protein BV20DRAFT_60012 [Pilatotrama ljubarskyi]